MDATEPITLMTWADMGASAPLILLTLGAIAVLLADLFLPSKRRDLLPMIALGAIAVAFLGVWAQTGLGREPRFAYHELLRFDSLTRIADVVILGALAFLVLISPRFFRTRIIPQGEYYTLLLFSGVGMMALASSNELLSLFINFEFLSLTLYTLAGIERENLRSTEAAFKYFLFGSFSAAFLLFGITLIYGATGETQYDKIAAILVAGPLANPGLMVAGLALMMVGFGFKLTLAPFHMYAPDLYAGAPAPVAGAIATGSKIAATAALFGVFRVFTNWTALPAGFYWAFTTVAILSILVGNLGALTQPNIKRLLAYSGVAHSGYAMVPLVAILAAARPGSGLVVADIARSAQEATGYYLMAYGLMTALAFGVIATLGPQGESNIDRYAGLARRSPFLAGVMALALLSLTGMPPTVGFFGKLLLFSVAVKAHLYLLASVAVVASVASAYYYLRIIVKMYMEERAEAKSVDYPPVENANTWALIGAAAGVFVFAIFQTLFLAS